MEYSWTLNYASQYQSSDCTFE